MFICLRCTTKTGRSSHVLQNRLTPVLFNKATRSECSLVHDGTLILTEIVVCAVWYKEVSSTKLAVSFREDPLSNCLPAFVVIESIPVTVLQDTSTKRRHCSTQQTVRRTAKLSKLDSTMTCRMHPRIDHSIIKTHG